MLFILCYLLLNALQLPWRTNCIALCPDMEQMILKWETQLSGFTDKFRKDHRDQYAYADVLRCSQLKPMQFFEIGLGCDSTFTAEEPKAWRSILPNAYLNYLEYDRNCTSRFPDSTRNVNGKVFFGDQGDVKVLDTVIDGLRGGVDIVIDDGSHLS